MEKIQYGIIGSGMHALQSHALPTATLAGCELIAVCDTSQDSMDRFTAGYGQEVQQFTDRSQFLQSAIGAVLIATPDEYHFSDMVAALQAGKDVFVEKPLTVSPKELQPLHTLLQAAAHNGRRVSSCHPRRFDPPFVWLKDSLPDLMSEFGQPIHLNFDFSYAKPSKSWKHDRGLLLDHANHEIDLTNYLFGHSSFQATRLIDSYDHYQIAGIRDDEIAFHFSGTRRLDAPRYPEWVQLRFEAGQVELDAHNGRARLIDHTNNVIEQLDIPATNYASRGRATMANFIGTITGQEVSCLSSEDLYVNTATSVTLTHQPDWRYSRGNT